MEKKDDLGISENGMSGTSKIISNVSKLLSKEARLLDQSNWLNVRENNDYPDVVVFEFGSDRRYYIYNKKLNKLFSKRGFDYCGNIKIGGMSYIFGKNEQSAPHLVLYDADGNKVKLIEGYYVVSSMVLWPIDHMSIEKVIFIDKKLKQNKEVIYITNTRLKAELYGATTVTTIRTKGDDAQQYIVIKGTKKDGKDIEFCFAPQRRRFYKYEDRNVGERINVDDDGWLIL